MVVGGSYPPAEMYSAYFTAPPDSVVACYGTVPSVLIITGITLIFVFGSFLNSLFLSIFSFSLFFPLWLSGNISSPICRIFFLVNNKNVAVSDPVAKMDWFFWNCKPSESYSFFKIFSHTFCFLLIFYMLQLQLFSEFARYVLTQPLCHPLAQSAGAVEYTHCNSAEG